MAQNAIGIVELTGVAAGFTVTDTMLKARSVELLLARTICSGKYLAMVGGDMADVETAVDAGLLAAEGTVVNTCCLSNLHPDVFAAVSGANVPGELAALGVMQSFSVAALIEAADAAVEAAVQAGSERITAKGLLVNRTVIPRLRPELLSEMI